MQIIVRLLVSSVVVVLSLVVTQDVQIFPGALLSVFNHSERLADELPQGVESIFVSTDDDERIELWRLPSRSKLPVAIVFHGNAGDVGNFFPYQKYFESLGIASYGFDYRGYGKSSGWPSEKGLYKDARAVVKYVLGREDIAEKDLIIVGVSIGSAPAAHIASQIDPGALILFSPFISLPDAVQSTPFLGFLSPFTFYDFPVKRDVSQLKNSCLVVAHGKKDSIIPFAHGRAVFDSYKGSSHSTFLTSQEASHNDIFFKVSTQLTKELRSCFKF